MKIERSLWLHAAVTLALVVGALVCAPMSDAAQQGGDEVQRGDRRAPEDHRDDPPVEL